MLHINEFIENSGTQRLIKEGYSLFVSSYVKDVWTSSSEIFLQNGKTQCWTIVYFCYKNKKPEYVLYSSKYAERFLESPQTNTTEVIVT